MAQTDSVFSLFPAVKNVRDTPFQEHDSTRLEYTPELIKAVFARRYFLNMAWAKIAHELNIDVEQVRRAYGRGRTVKVNPDWATVTPILTYTTIHVTPEPAPRQPKTRSPSTKPCRWGDEVVGWVLAQHDLMQRSAAAIWRSFERFYPISGGPSNALILKWVNRETKQAEGIVVTRELLDYFPFYETEEPVPQRMERACASAKEVTLSDSALRAKRCAEARAKGRVFLRQLEEAKREHRSAP